MRERLRNPHRFSAAAIRSFRLREFVCPCVANNQLAKFLRPPRLTHEVVQGFGTHQTFAKRNGINGA
jgi:hypothetical protein